MALYAVGLLQRGGAVRIHVMLHRMGKGGPIVIICDVLIPNYFTASQIEHFLTYIC